MEAAAGAASRPARPRACAEHLRRCDSASAAALVDGALLPGDVALEDGVVTGLGFGAPADGERHRDAGLVDLQVNGFAGVDLQAADAGGFRSVGEALLRAGTTAYLPTFITAPEERLVAALRTRGVTVSCALRGIRRRGGERVRRGREHPTHLFNAMPKQDGLAAAALARADVTVQVIVDGHHVAPDIVRHAWRSAAGRLALVSDAVAAAGMGDGEFTLGSVHLTARDGVVRSAGGALAGTTLTLRVLQAVAFASWPWR